ncbi:hypothetical protein ACEQPO_08490 [Bacillus sp. SL00103]
MAHQNEKTILKKGDGKGGLDRRIRYFLLIDSVRGRDEKRLINKKEVKEYKNQSIAGKYLCSVGIFIYRFASHISLGMPFFLIAFLNFLIQIIVLAIAFFFLCLYPVLRSTILYIVVSVSLGRDVRIVCLESLADSCACVCLCNMRYYSQDYPSNEFRDVFSQCSSSNVGYLDHCIFKT